MKLKFKNDAYTGRLPDGNAIYLILPRGDRYDVFIGDDGCFQRVEDWFDTKQKAMAYCARLGADGRQDGEK